MDVDGISTCWIFGGVKSIALLGSPTQWVRIGGVAYSGVVGVVTLATNNHHEPTGQCHDAAESIDATAVR